MIGRSGERWSRISVLAARRDDDDIYIYIYTGIYKTPYCVSDKTIPRHHLDLVNWSWNATSSVSCYIPGFRTTLLLYSQRFSRIVLRLSSGVSCRNRKPTRNFKQRPLFNPRGSLPLILLTLTGLVFLYCYSPAVRIEPATSRRLSLRSLGNQHL